MPMTMTAPPTDRLTPLRRMARLMPGGMALGRWLRHRIDPELRSIRRARQIHGDGMFQPFPTTSEDRYPELFDRLAECLADLPCPRILSFGCSSGAEVRALRSRLPLAQITGIDVNPRMIAKARKADANPLSTYRLASAPKPDDRFDAILALAVFRHGELRAARPDDCSAIFPFSHFASGIAMLDACLVPGGWLAVANAHFRLGDTALASQYHADPLRLPLAEEALCYGPDNRMIAGSGLDDLLFRKTGDTDPAGENGHDDTD